MTIVRVAMDDLHSAFVTWVDYEQHQGKDLAENRLTFQRFMDDALLPSYFGYLGSWGLTEEQARRMNLLLGPHSRTAIAAYYALKK